MCRISLSVPPMMGRNDSRTVGIEPSKRSDSMRRGGDVSRPCHNVASLKYSFWAPVRYGPWPAGYWWGGIQHVIQTEQDNPPTGSESWDNREWQGDHELRNRRHFSERPRRGGNGCESLRLAPSCRPGPAGPSSSRRTWPSN